MPGDRTLVPLLFDAWDDLDRAYAGMTAEEATERPDGASAFGWTLRHLIGGFDFYVNEVMRGGAMHPTFAREHAEYEFSGECGDWEGIAAAAREVRAEAEAFFGDMSDAALAGDGRARLGSVPGDDAALPGVPHDRARLLPHRGGGDAAGAGAGLPGGAGGRVRGTGAVAW